MLLETEADNTDLIELVIFAALEGSHHIEPFDRHAAASICHNMLAHHVRYFAEHATQLIRLPWRLLSDGVGDCKSQAVFIASVCAASGCDVILRFVSMPGTDYFGHVYAVVDGVAVDPLLNFGDECNWLDSIDVPIPSPGRGGGPKF